MNRPVRPDRQPVSRATDTTLTRPFYTSPAIFEDEIERIFFRQWTYAGHVSQIPDVGDYFLHDFAGESLIVVRDGVDSIRAHFNVCRHRGSRLTKVERGHARTFTCPYHQWAYGLDGRLKRAPMMPDRACIDYADLPLKPAAAEVWAGMIFVNLSPKPESTIAALVGPPPDGLARLEPEHMKAIRRERLVVKANWKTLLENYLECYHCAASHPELGVAFDIESSYVQTGTWAGACFLGGEPVRQGFATVSMTGDLVSTPLGRHAGSEPLELEVTEGLGLLPVLTRALFHVDHAVVHAMDPIAVDAVGWTSTWFVRADAVEGRDYDPDRVAAVWRATNAEDKALCERNYQGVLSRTFMPGPLNPRAEAAIRPVLDLYLGMMDTRPD